MKDKIAVIVDKALWILIIVIFACMMYSTLRYDAVSIFGYGFGTVMSGSMLPEYEIGGTILIDYGRKPKVGEVAVYEYGDSNIVHRVQSINEVDNVNMYTFKGDNNELPDYEEVSEDRIVGTVVLHFNGTAELMEKLHMNVVSYVGLLGFISIVILILIVVGELRNNYRAKK
jgi:signal peptidase I